LFFFYISDTTKMVRRKITRRRQPIRRKRMRFNRQRRGKRPAHNRQTISARPGFGMVRQPFAPNMFTTFTYADTVQLLQGGAGTPGILQYRANGPFKPRVASGSVQPRYFDTLLGTNGGTAPYDHYRVHAAKIVITIWPESPSAGSANGIVAVIPERSTISNCSSFEEVMERPYCKSVAMTTLGSYKPRKIKHFVKMKTILGVKDLADDVDSASLYNTNPNSQVYFNIYTCAVDFTDVLSPRIQILITYFVQLYNLVDVADS